MNTAHFRTFLWLRWRLIVNQFGRSGSGGLILSGILAVVITAGSVLTLIAGFAVGLVALRTATPLSVMLAWDVTIVIFTVFWFAGLMAELQRSDAISLDRFLHLPVSPSSAFAINFVGSSVSLALILVLPAMLGLAAGLVASRGWGMMVLFASIAAFLLMMSALAYQFRGWLASLMQNPRRRRTILAVVPLVIVFGAQLPNAWNTLGPGAQERRAAAAERRRVIAQLDRDRAAGRITSEEYQKRRPAPPPREDNDYATARLLNKVAPPGWLAYSAEAAASGHPWPALAGVLGMAIIGTLSLRRAYGTTLRLYRGDFEDGRRRVSMPAGATRPSPVFMARRLPWASDRVSAIATATMRSWSRAPEMKIALLTPLFMLLAFGRMFAAGGNTVELIRPLKTSAMAGMVLILAMAGPIANQFAYDRAGFRTYVLGPVPRRDVLLGKNLAALPFSLALMATMVGVSQWFMPMRADHFAGLLLQLLSMYLMFCLAGNLWSIVTPVALKSGTAMPVPRQGMRSFAHVLFMPVAAIAMAVTLLPLGVEALFAYMHWLDGVPAYVVLGGCQLIGLALLYVRALHWQGSLLQRREQQILDVVGVVPE